MAWNRVRQLSNTDKRTGTQHPKMSDRRRVVHLLRHYHFSSRQMLGQEIIISHSLGTPVTTAFFFFLLCCFSFLFLIRALSYCRDMSYFYPGIAAHEKNKWKIQNFKNLQRTLSPSIWSCTWNSCSCPFCNPSTTVPSNIKSIRHTWLLKVI